MLKKKILVRKVYNLTDARYFSAMNVDWISFDLSDGLQELLVKHYSEIMAWIEGPSFLVEAGDNKALEILQMIPQIDGLISTNDMNLDEHPSLKLFVPISLDDFLGSKVFHSNAKDITFIVEPKLAFSQLSQADVAGLKRKGKSFDYYLDLKNETSPEEYLLTLPGLQGLVFYGGAEEKVGIKSFEEMDEWFDFLMQE